VICDLRPLRYGNATEFPKNATGKDVPSWPHFEFFDFWAHGRPSQRQRHKSPSPPPTPISVLVSSEVGDNAETAGNVNAVVYGMGDAWHPDILSLFEGYIC
jgi:hypothetical protein